VKFLKGFTVILAFLVLGEIGAEFLNLPIPGNIVGLMLLLLCLTTGLVPLKIVERASDIMISNLALLFIPVGVGIIKHLNLIRDQFLPLIAATVLSTVIVMVITAKMADSLFASKHKKGG